MVLFLHSSLHAARPPVSSSKQREPGTPRKAASAVGEVLFCLGAVGEWRNCFERFYPWCSGVGSCFPCLSRGVTSFVQLANEPVLHVVRAIKCSRRRLLVLCDTIWRVQTLRKQRMCNTLSNANPRCGHPVPFPRAICCGARSISLPAHILECDNHHETGMRQGGIREVREQT